MRIIFKKDATALDIAAALDLAGDLSGCPDSVRVETIDSRVIAHIPATSHDIDPTAILEKNGVEKIEDIESPYRIAGTGDTSDGIDLGRWVIEIPYADAKIGSGDFTVMAGPCAVEDENSLIETARVAKSCGAKFLRGGAYKPRTSPYSFQGIGDEGLKILKHARDMVGIGVITEAMEPATVEKVAEVADIIQIGSRNMQNFPLLREVGRQDKPVLLKRGMSATLEEWLGAAEYILIEGNRNVILCERGIRTFSRHSRHTLDLGVIPVIHERTKLPVLVDPSHATGLASRVPSMSKAALAAGADGLLVEIHPNPPCALSDSAQALTFDEFTRLMNELNAISDALGRAVRQS